MKTITIKGGIYIDTGKYADPENPYRFFSGDPTDFNEYIAIMLHQITAEVPDDFDPRPAKIAALEAKKQELRAEFAAKVTEIERKISELQAITFEAA